MRFHAAARQVRPRSRIISVVEESSLALDLMRCHSVQGLILRVGGAHWQDLSLEIGLIGESCSDILGIYMTMTTRTSNQGAKKQRQKRTPR
jgi:hypothetical protein